MRKKKGKMPILAAKSRPCECSFTWPAKNRYQHDVDINAQYTPPVVDPENFGGGGMIKFIGTNCV